MKHKSSVAVFLLVWLGLPSLAFAQEQAQTVSLFRMFLLPDDPVGVLITWMLVMLSALSIGYTGSLVLRYQRKKLLPEDTHKQVVRMLDGRRFREAIDFVAKDTSYLGKVIHAALKEAGHGFGAMERGIEEAGDSETTKALRPIEYLNVLGNIAPMIGLFGTVYGMIRAFDQLQASGGKPDPAQLAGGISTAMITTFWGLIVAIPALASYALIRNKIDALTSEGMLIAEQIIAPFKPVPAQVRQQQQQANQQQANNQQTQQNDQQQNKQPPKPDSDSEPSASDPKP